METDLRNVPSSPPKLSLCITLDNNHPHTQDSLVPCRRPASRKRLNPHGESPLKKAAKVLPPQISKVGLGSTIYDNQPLTQD